MNFEIALNLAIFSDIDATRTLRIREIKGTDVRAFFGRMYTMYMVLKRIFIDDNIKGIELKTIVFG